jgi:hypothetical protein
VLAIFRHAGRFISAVFERTAGANAARRRREIPWRSGVEPPQAERRCPMKVTVPTEAKANLFQAAFERMAGANAAPRGVRIGGKAASSRRTPKERRSF